MGKMMHDTKNVGIAVLAVLGLGCFTPGAALADETAVHVAHDHLDPREVSVKVGDSVSFHNHAHDHPAHIIVAEDGSFRSPPLSGDDYWSHTFTKPGTHVYGVDGHEKTSGKIVVK